MSFRKSNNQTDQWRAFCARHDRYVSQLPRLASVFATADRFDFAGFLPTVGHPSAVAFA
jgi:hypothetical protein